MRHYPCCWVGITASSKLILWNFHVPSLLNPFNKVFFAFIQIIFSYVKVHTSLIYLSQGVNWNLFELIKKSAQKHYDKVDSFIYPDSIGLISSGNGQQNRCLYFFIYLVIIFWGMNACAFFFLKSLQYWPTIGQ